ncbi:MAG TPA: hypothetical protein VGS80_25860 [Ktedonobacterales bacterium]|nr:hypothetical protein [Ktedonobacterales bacterium]
MDREPLSVRKTCTYKLPPTAQQEATSRKRRAGSDEQEATRAFVVRRCRALANAALTQRREAWRMRRVGSTRAAQSAQLPASKAVRPD